MAPRRTRPLLALLTVLALVVGAACSDDPPSSSSSDTGGEESAASAEDWELLGEAEAKDVDRDGTTPPAVRPFAALMCRSAGKADTFGVTPDHIQGILTGTGRSIDGYVKEMSYGALSIAGSRAFGWFDLPKASNAYADSVAGAHEITRDCAAAAVAGGADLSPFSNVLIYTNGELDGAMGFTTGSAPITVGGQQRNVTTIVVNERGLNSPPLVLHELGHVIGGSHTGSRTDPLGGGAGLGDRWTVTWNPKRNASIAPGYDASTRDAAGWIPTDRKARHTGGTATYPLARLTQPGPNGSLLVDVPIGTSGARYVVSARTRTGYDDQPSLENTPFLGFAIPTAGVVIEKVAAGRDTEAMTSPNTGESNTIWTAGQTYTDAANGITIKVDAFDDNGGTVTVTAPGTATATTTTAPPATTAPAPTTTTTTAPPGSTVPAQTAPVETVPPTEPPPTTAAPSGGTPSDDAAGAPSVTLPASITASTVGRGNAGEPSPCGDIGATIWVKVTMPASGEIDVSTVGSDFDTVLAFHTDLGGGSDPTKLSNIDCIDDANGSSQASGPMRGPAGGVLFLQVGGYRGATGNLVLKITAR